MLKTVLMQSLEVSGRVTDDLGEGLPGVNIIIKGTTTGTVTDGDGDYRIEVSGQHAVLVFSFVGFLGQEVVVGAQSRLTTCLSEG